MIELELRLDAQDSAFRDEVRQFLAVREAAHRRLFVSVPWLEGDLVRKVHRHFDDRLVDPVVDTCL